MVHVLMSSGILYYIAGSAAVDQPVPTVGSYPSLVMAPNLPRTSMTYLGMHIADRVPWKTLRFECRQLGREGS